jgi:protein phosphatase
MQSTPYHWQSAARSDVGKVRKVNEDALLSLNEQRLWAVADGMGGHAAGDVASKAVVDALRAIKLRPEKLSAYVDTVDDTLQSVNQQLRSLGQKQGGLRTIGSTVICLLALNNYIAYVWAGDSRVYRLRGDELKQLNKDHSEVQRLLDEGIITAEQGETHPSANTITKAIGAATDVFVEVGIDRVEPGDIYLLCSDGLYREITLEQIATTLKRGDIEWSGDRLLQLVLSNKAADNVSFIIAKPTL